MFVYVAAALQTDQTPTAVQQQVFVLLHNKFVKRSNTIIQNVFSMFSVKVTFSSDNLQQLLLQQQVRSSRPTYYICHTFITGLLFSYRWCRLSSWVLGVSWMQGFCRDSKTKSPSLEIIRLYRLAPSSWRDRCVTAEGLLLYLPCCSNCCYLHAPAQPETSVFWSRWRPCSLSETRARCCWRVSSSGTNRI